MFQALGTLALLGNHGMVVFFDELVFSDEIILTVLVDAARLFFYLGSLPFSATTLEAPSRASFLSHVDPQLLLPWLQAHCL